MPESFLWDDFQDRDPEHMPEVGPNGASIRETSWENVRAKNDGGALKLDMRPPAFDGKTYESEDAYYAHADESDPALREYERKDLDDLYAGYHTLGGNHFVDDLYEKMRAWKVVK